MEAAVFNHKGFTAMPYFLYYPFFSRFFCNISNIEIDWFLVALSLPGIFHFLIVYFFEDNVTKSCYILFLTLFTTICIKIFPEVMYPYIEYTSYLQQASSEGGKLAQDFSREMANKSNFDIYSELDLRVKKEHVGYLSLQTKIEEIKKSDKRRKSLFWMYRAIIKDSKAYINENYRSLSKPSLLDTLQSGSASARTGCSELLRHSSNDIYSPQTPEPHMNFFIHHAFIGLIILNDSYLNLKERIYLNFGIFKFLGVFPSIVAISVIIFKWGKHLPV